MLSGHRVSFAYQPTRRKEDMAQHDVLGMKTCLKVSNLWHSLKYLIGDIYQGVTIETE